MKTLAVLDPRAAFVDVGSEHMHVSVGGDEPAVFGTVTQQRGLRIRSPVCLANGRPDPRLLIHAGIITTAAAPAAIRLSAHTRSKSSHAERSTRKPSQR